MAYTRPASDAANLAWNGIAPYTRPAQDAANLSFIQGTTYPVVSLGVVSQFGTPNGAWDQFCDVSGFAPVQFGTPTHRRTQPVEGFAPVQFGTPAGHKLQRVEGFFPVQFGTPRLHPSHIAPWPVSTQFGTPTARQFWKVPTLGVITKFGTPTTPTNRTGEVSGFAPVRFGKPLAIRHSPPGTNIICRVEGFSLSLFGTPSARWGQTGAVSAIAPTVQFGTPRAILTGHVDSIAPTVQFGTPTVRTKHQVSGFRPVAFGLARAILTQRVTGMEPAVRFGTPKAIRSNWYEVRGFMPVRFGTPRGYQRNNHHVAGFMSAQFGTPAAYQTHRVISIPPITRFGKPMLKRTTQC